MVDETEGPQPTRPNHCQKCSAPYRLAHQVLDTKTGKTVRVHLCSGCGESKWEW
jgi:hypothetical protein